MTIKNNIKNDYNNYKKYIKQRELFINSESETFENYFSIIHIIIQILLRQNKYAPLKQSKDYERVLRSKVVENLIKTIEFLNLKHIKDVDKCYRSIIEAFCKYCLEIERIEIYISNCKKGEFKATDLMKELKSISTSQKIGKLTSYTTNYFSKMDPNFNKLYQYYSEFSESVHVSVNYTEPTNLLQYNEIEVKEIENNIKKYKEILKIIGPYFIEKIEKLYDTQIINREEDAYLRSLL
ncbi:hypothetical protein PYM76_01445 [Staphylococcus epidermidis]|nr:hypothetical protein [Staphylococcus epidermidis]